MTYPMIKITGDSSVAVSFGDEISEEINARVIAFDEIISRAQIDGIVETVPAYCTLTIHYDPAVIRYRPLRDKLEALLSEAHSSEKKKALIMEIPVLYGGEYGPDLAFVAEHNRMTPEDVIRIHSGREYLIYMLGFTPGFPYMGGMDERIAAPRLQAPRLRIPAGSVGIAGGQTGIYPIDSPGGWQLIGRTPVTLYDPARKEPILLEAGLRVRFTPIDQAEYDRICALEAAGRYRCRTRVKEDS